MDRVANICRTPKQFFKSAFRCIPLQMSSLDKDVQGSQAYKAEERTILFQIFVDTRENWKQFGSTLWSE